VGVASVWRLLLPVVPALFFAWLVEWGCARHGVYPPGFRDPLRRWVARLALAGVLYIGVFLPLGMIGTRMPEDLTAIPTPRLFLLHLLMLAALALWMLAGYAGVRGPRQLLPTPVEAAPGPEPPPPVAPPLTEPPGAVAWEVAQSAAPLAPPGQLADELPGQLADEPAPGDRVEPLAAAPLAPPPPDPSFFRRVAAQLGLLAPSPGREIGLGLVLGVGIWAAVLVAIIAIALLLMAFGAGDLLPKQPPALIPFLAALPFGVRLLLSLSAGVVEETFFRGFLQPRIGILLSTALFALAHASYGQPFMLVGVSLLSLIYALLVRWRQTVWPAIAAHALFDGVQLLVVVPAALKFIHGAGGAARSVAALAGMG
jgi:membrane protease YdiL (CAAX protease family)